MEAGYFPKFTRQSENEFELEPLTTLVGDVGRSRECCQPVTALV